MDKLQYTQTLVRMNKDIRQNRREIDALMGGLRERMIERANFINAEFYKGE